MKIERHTGCYIRTNIVGQSGKAPDRDALAQLHEAIGDRRDLNDPIGQGADFAEWVIETLDELDAGCRADALRDANTIVAGASILRAAIERGDVNAREINLAVRLGRFIERLAITVGPERYARAAVKSRKASVASRKDLANRRATFWRDLYLRHKQDHLRASEAERWRWVSAQAYKLSWTDTEDMPAEYGHNSDSKPFNPDYIRKSVRKNFGAL